MEMAEKNSYDGARPSNIGEEGTFSTMEQWERRFILTSMPAAGIANTLTIYVAAGASYRVAIYSSASGTNSSGMTLVYDFGVITNSGGTNTWISSASSTGSPSIAAGAYPVVAIKGEGEPWVAATWNESLPLNAIIASRRAWLESGAGTSSPFASTGITDSGENLPTRTMGLSFAYTTASAPAFTAGPTVSNVSGTGFDVASTVDQNATLQVVVTTANAGQPTTQQFIDSTETASATANVSATVHHTGQ
jgi:hypothetical protein